MDLLLIAALGRLQLVHGREVYRDGDNDTYTQLQRLARLQHSAQRESAGAGIHLWVSSMTS